MIDAPLAYAFAAGMVAVVNPCGFALLPAYLSYFLGLEEAPADARAGVVRSLGVAAAVTGGFVLVFGAMGLALTQLSLSIDRATWWLPMVIGAALAALGVAMLFGFQLMVRLPKVSMGSASRELSSMFLFGVSYAVASLSCTLPIFLPLMTLTFERSNTASGVAVFLTYALGMGLLLCAITLTIGLARGALLSRLRRAQPYISRISGGLLVLAGLYLVYYGYWARGVFADARSAPAAGPVGVVLDIESWFRGRLDDLDPVRVGVVLGAGVVIALILALGTRRPPRPGGPGPAGEVSTSDDPAHQDQPTT